MVEREGERRRRSAFRPGERVGAWCPPSLQRNTGQTGRPVHLYGESIRLPCSVTANGQHFPLPPGYPRFSVAIPPAALHQPDLVLSSSESFPHHSSAVSLAPAAPHALQESSQRPLVDVFIVERSQRASWRTRVQDETWWA